MKTFTQLCRDLEAELDPNFQALILRAYLDSVPREDAAWAIFLLSQRRLSRMLSSEQLRASTMAAAGHPDWLVEECVAFVGDADETMALLLPREWAQPCPPPATPPDDTTGEDLPHLQLQPPVTVPTLDTVPTLSRLLEEVLLPAAGCSEGHLRQLLWSTWPQFNLDERQLWHQFLRGSIAPPLPRPALVAALASLVSLPPAVLELRLRAPLTVVPKKFGPASHRRSRANPISSTLNMPSRKLAQSSWQKLTASIQPHEIEAIPDPVPAISELTVALDALGPADAWVAEWLWLGSPVQLVRTSREVLIWSARQEILSPAYPDIVKDAEALPPGTLLEGQLVEWSGSRAHPLSQGQPRKQAHEQGGLSRLLLAHNARRWDGVEFTGQSWPERRTRLEKLWTAWEQRRSSPVQEQSGRCLSQGDFFQAAAPEPTPEAAAVSRLKLAPLLRFNSWPDAEQRLQEARSLGATGLRLHHARFETGLQADTTWDWKLPPLVMRAVATAAEPGSGRHAGWFSEFNVALWSGDRLIPIAPTMGGLPEKDLAELQPILRHQVQGRFGPVRVLRPELVLEFAFDHVAASPRHRGGLVLVNPRLLSWCRGVPPSAAGQIDALRHWVAPQAESVGS